MVRVSSDFFGDRDVRDLRPLHIEDYQASLEKTLSPKSVKNYLDHFKSFLRWCCEKKGIIGRIPVFPDLLKLEPAPKWISQEDQIDLYEHVPDEDKPIIAFLMLHGCRPGEARALRAKDVDLRRQVITISRTWSGTQIREVRKGPRGSAEPYSIGIHPEMREWIEKRVREVLPESFLFVNHGHALGRHYTQSALEKIWKHVREAAGIKEDLRLYDATRHSFASNLSNSGTDLKKLKDMMGHADIRTTLKYAHGNVEHTRADLAKLSLRKKPGEVMPIRKGQ
jgi:integrase